MKAFLVMGLFGYAAAYYVFDTSRSKAVWSGLIIGALADFLAEQKPLHLSSASEVGNTNLSNSAQTPQANTPGNPGSGTPQY